MFEFIFRLVDSIVLQNHKQIENIEPLDTYVYDLIGKGHTGFQFKWKKSEASKSGFFRAMIEDCSRRVVKIRERVLWSRRKFCYDLCGRCKRTFHWRSVFFFSQFLFEDSDEWLGDELEQCWWWFCFFSFANDFTLRRRRFSLGCAAGGVYSPRYGRWKFVAFSFLDARNGPTEKTPRTRSRSTELFFSSDTLARAKMYQSRPRWCGTVIKIAKIIKILTQYAVDAVTLWR